MNITHYIYKEAYEKYNELSWLTPSIFGQTTVKWHIDGKFFQVYIEKFNELYLLKYPKRKPLTPEKINNIFASENHVDKHIEIDTYNYINPLVNDYLIQSKQEYDDCEYILQNSILPTVELTNDFIMYESSNSTSYNTQGFGAYKYARQALFMYELICEANNIPFEIREIRTDYNHNSLYSLQYSIDYQFWCKCEKYQLYHLIIQNKTTTLELAKLCWKRGVNPKVLFPTMSEKVYHKSLNEWNK